MNVEDFVQRALTDHARDMSAEPDVAALVARGTQARRRRRLAIAASIVATVVIGAIVVGPVLTNTAEPPPVVGTPTAPTSIEATTTVGSRTGNAFFAGSANVPVPFTIPAGWEMLETFAVVKSGADPVSAWRSSTSPTSTPTAANGSSSTPRSAPASTTSSPHTRTCRNSPAAAAGITVDGFDGKQIQFTVPDYTDDNCKEDTYALVQADNAGTEHRPTRPPNLWAQAPNQQTTASILDVDGTRLVIFTIQLRRHLRPGPHRPRHDSRLHRHRLEHPDFVESPADGTEPDVISACIYRVRRARSADHVRPVIESRRIQMNVEPSPHRPPGRVRHTIRGITVAVVATISIAACSPDASDAPTAADSRQPTATAVASPSTSSEATATAGPQTGTGFFAGSANVPVRFTIPPGWEMLETLAVVKSGADPIYGVAFYDVANIYADGCRWELVDPPVGAGVDDLVTAYRKVPKLRATPARNVTVDGFDGKQLQFTVPDYTDDNCKEDTYALVQADNAGTNTGQPGGSRTWGRRPPSNRPPRRSSTSTAPGS